MSQKSGNNVKPPVSDKAESPESQTIHDHLNTQHHCESTKSPQDDKKIGQSNGAGRPPLKE